MIASAPEWYALYLKSRHEFIAWSELRRKGIETFLPLAKKLRLWKDRRKFIEFPLFPGYIFVCSSPEPGHYLHILKTRGVVNIVSARAGQPVPVSPEEINSLKLLLASGQKLDIYPHLSEGARVRVRRGPLSGAEGVLVRKEDEYMLMVNIEILGRSVSVRIYADDVETA